MLNEQLAVREFMESFNQKTREFYAPPLDGERILRARLIMEEAMETAQALLSGTGVNKLFWQGQSITFAPAGGEPRRPEKEDLHHVIDGLCDLLRHPRFLYNLRHFCGTLLRRVPSEESVQILDQSAERKSH